MTSGKERAACAPDAQASWPWPFAVWATVGRMAPPALRLHLRRRARRGKEDETRLAERFGWASAPRPAGPVVWMHAASVGEALSAAALSSRVAQDAAVVFTTGTITAQTLMAARATPNVHLQYAPLDTPQGAARFIAHWRPRAALFFESELWPNSLRAAQAAGVRLGLVNARLSPRSFRRWSRAPRSAGRLLGLFDVLLAQSAPDAERLRGLGARAEALGDLKSAAAPVVPRRSLGRPVWLAASVHPEDAPAFAAAQAAVRAVRPDALTILAPRHPEKTDEILAAFGAIDGRITKRSEQDAPTADDAVFVVDRLGELAHWAAASDVAAMGGGFGRRGGHNPLEPARAGAAVVLPPDMAHFEEVAGALAACGGAAASDDPESFARAVAALMADDDRRAAMAAAGAAYADARATGALDRISDALAPLWAQPFAGPVGEAAASAPVPSSAFGP